MILILALSALGAALVAWRLAHAAGRRAAASLVAQRRLLRLAASDLRAPALTLLGHAAHVPSPLGATLVAVCRGLLETAEALEEQTDEPGQQRVLRIEDVRLGRLLEFVVAQVAGQLGPGRRAWRIDPALHMVVLLGDRRALHQILLRLVSGAAMATTEGDGIALRGAAHGDAWALTIEDEGTGLAAARIDGVGLETRGLGVGLALVRSLMQAHGGSLSFESTSLVGTRAVLTWPLTRVSFKEVVEESAA
jgi:signal transduction histidine kinase